LPADFLAVELRDALEALPHALGKGADGVPRLPHRHVLAVQPLLALLQLVIEQRERLLVRADLAQADIALDLATVELAVHLRALVLNLGLSLLLKLLGRDGRFAPRDLDQLRCLFVRRPPDVPRQRPDDEEADAAAHHHEKDGQPPIEDLFAIGGQEGQNRCAC